MSSNTHNIEKHILNRFNIIKNIGSGAYGHVWKVQEKSTHKVLALKKIFDAFQHSTDAQRTYREIEILRQLNHPNIIKLYQTIPAQNNRDVYLVFQYMQTDLHNVIGQNIIKDIHIKFIIYQLAKALKYLHSGNIIHRDLKPSNILINSDCTIKLCDFGLVRSLKTINQNHILTEGVATRWYRSPEILLGSKSYSTPADIWSFGCIIYQILLENPLFQGNSTLDQIQKICSLIGYPKEEDLNSIQSEISKSLIKQLKISNNHKLSHSIKNINPQYKALLDKMLIFNPKKRITIQEILRHELIRSFYKEEDDIVLGREITTPIDDNKKMSVEEYRRLIYADHRIPVITTPKSKYLSSSLGAGSVSPKYHPASHNIHSTLYPSTHYTKKEASQGGFKKISLQSMKTQSSTATDSKKPSLSYKPEIKYVRSTTNIMKHTNTQSPVNTYEFKYFRREPHSSIIQNQEEHDAIIDTKYPHYSHNLANDHKAIKDNNNRRQVKQYKLQDSASSIKKVSYYQYHPHPQSHLPHSHSHLQTNNQLSQHKPSLISSKNIVNKLILSQQQIKQKLSKFRSLKNQNLLKFHIYELPNSHQTAHSNNSIAFKVKHKQ